MFLLTLTRRQHTQQAGLEEVSRLDVAELWVRSIRRIWTREFILDSLRKCGVVPFTRLRHLEGNRHLVEIADCIARAEELSRREEAYEERQQVDRSIEIGAY